VCSRSVTRLLRFVLLPPRDSPSIVLARIRAVFLHENAAFVPEEPRRNDRSIVARVLQLYCTNSRRRRVPRLLRRRFARLARGNSPCLPPGRDLIDRLESEIFLEACWRLSPLSTSISGYRTAGNTRGRAGLCKARAKLANKPPTWRANLDFTEIYTAEYDYGELGRKTVCCCA